MSALTELRVSRCNLQPYHIAALSVLPSLRLAVLHLASDDLEFVAEATSSNRRIWRVSPSFGDSERPDNRMGRTGVERECGAPELLARADRAT